MKSNLYTLLCCVCGLLFGYPVNSGAQIIHTFAGNGTPAFGGDSGPAVSCYLNNPYGVCVDTSGNVYIADASNNRIRKVDSAGRITTFAGNGLAGAAGDDTLAIGVQLYSPWSVAADSFGNVYFTDAGNNRIRKVNAAGIITTIAGTGTWGYTGDGGPATAAEITGSYGVAADGMRNVFFSDPAHNIIRKINAAGIVSTIAGTGTAGATGDGGPAASAKLDDPYGVATDGSGNLFIADLGNNKIRMVNAAGIITTIAGNGTGGFMGDGTAATTAEINGPTSVAVDAAGNVYITDQGNSRVRKVSASGIITTIAGSNTPGYGGDGGPATAALLSSPSGVAVTHGGQIYIADYGNNRIRVLDDAPVFTRGDVQSLYFCGPGSSAIDSLLAVSVAGIGQTETWSLVLPPAHGTAIAAYTTTSTGSTLTPAGLTYTPVAGYTGSDSFKVRVGDGTIADTTTIHVTVQGLADPGMILGVNAVCAGYEVTLSETVAGGVWSCSNANATVASGVVSAVTVGRDTVIYTVSNACGPSQATFHIVIVPASNCDTSHTGTGTGVPVNSTPSAGALTVYPDPCYGTFTVNLSASTKEEARFVITNIVGIKVKDFSAAANTPVAVSLDVPPGIYVLSAANIYGRWCRKIVVQ